LIGSCRFVLPFASNGLTSRPLQTNPIGQVVLNASQVALNYIMPMRVTNTGYHTIFELRFFGDDVCLRTPPIFKFLTGFISRTIGNSGNIFAVRPYDGQLR
jgi:hypothetical protein